MWPFDQTQGAVPGYLPQDMPVPGYFDIRDLRRDAATQGLAQAFAGLSRTFARRPVTQPAPTVGEAFAGVQPAMQRTMMAGLQTQAAERQNDEARRWDELSAGNPMLQGLGRQLGGQYLVASLARDRREPPAGYAWADPSNPSAGVRAIPGYIHHIPGVGAVTAGDAPGPGAAPAPAGGQGNDLSAIIASPNMMRWQPQIAAAAREFNIPAPLLTAMLAQESRGDPNIVGPVTRTGERATGLGQFMPGTWADAQRALNLGTTPPTDPNAAIRAAAWYLRRNMDDFGGDTNTALAAYNWGPGNLRMMGIHGRALPPEMMARLPAETRNYIERITGASQAQPTQVAQAGPALPPGMRVVAPENERPVAIPDPNSPTGYRYVRQSEAVGQPAAGPNTLSVNSQPGGGVSVYSGPNNPQAQAQAAQPAQAVRSEIDQRIVDNTQRLGRLQEIATRFDPRFLQYGTQIQNWGRGIAERFGANLSPDARRDMQDFEQFRQTVSDEFNQTLRAMSGAAVTPSEFERMRAAAPSLDDSPTQFQAKLRSTLENIALANARLHYYRAQGIRPTFNTDGGVSSLDNMRGLIQARGDVIANTLRGQGMAPDEVSRRVREQIQTEFGISPMGLSR